MNREERLLAFWSALAVLVSSIVSELSKTHGPRAALLLVAYAAAVVAYWLIYHPEDRS